MGIKKFYFPKEAKATGAYRILANPAEANPLHTAAALVDHAATSLAAWPDMDENIEVKTAIECFDFLLREDFKQPLPKIQPRQPEIVIDLDGKPEKLSLVKFVNEKTLAFPNLQKAFYGRIQSYEMLTANRGRRPNGKFRPS